MRDERFIVEVLDDEIDAHLRRGERVESSKIFVEGCRRFWRLDFFPLRLERGGASVPNCFSCGAQLRHRMRMPEVHPEDEARPRVYEFIGPRQAVSDMNIEGVGRRAVQAVEKHRFKILALLRWQIGKLVEIGLEPGCPRPDRLRDELVVLQAAVGAGPPG